MRRAKERKKRSIWENKSGDFFGQHLSLLGSPFKRICLLARSREREKKIKAKKEQEICNTSVVVIAFFFAIYLAE